MLKTKPMILASVSQETCRARESLLDAGISAARPTRVLLIAPSLDIIGGQSIQASELLRSLAKDPQIQVRFLEINPRLPSALRMKYVRTVITLGLYLVRLLTSIPHADILHIFTPGFFSFFLAPAPALLLARLLGKPAILNYHDGRAEDHLAHSPMARAVMALASKIVVPSDYLACVFARFGLRATRIHNAVEVSFLPYRTRLRPRPVFLHNRGLGAEYNPACTLRAFALVQQRYPDARLVIAHDGPLRRSLEALAQSLGLRQIYFTGSVSPEAMAALYDSADIYLMSPNADNMPLSVLECFGAGLPVVSSDAGGIAGMIHDQDTGLLFPPGDHHAMAACVFRLLEEPGLAARLAANARAQCARYSWSRIVPQWIWLYDRLLDDSINSE